jgi:hypothetical protein
LQKKKTTIIKRILKRSIDSSTLLLLPVSIHHVLFFAKIHQKVGPEFQNHDQTPSFKKMSTTEKETTGTSSAATAPPPKRQKTGTASSSSSTAAAPIFSSTRNINKVPVEVWKEHICQKFLNLTELSILRRCHTFFEKYWQNVIVQNVIRVPQGCPTVEKAMALAVIFSERKEYTEAEIVGNAKRVNVTCSHITFVGKGKDQTTIRGGFRVVNQQHVQFEELTITNSGGGSGLYLTGSETNVDVLKCAVKECRSTGLFVTDGATVTATQCEFMENGRHGVMENGKIGVFCTGANTKARFNDCALHHNIQDGLIADGFAVVDLHGTKTDIHSNKRHGIRATNRAKVNIHLPSQHNTSHDNGREDRHQERGGSIANINADGTTFTHT